MASETPLANKQDDHFSGCLVAHFRRTSSAQLQRGRTLAWSRSASCARQLSVRPTQSAPTMDATSTIRATQWPLVGGANVFS